MRRANAEAQGAITVDLPSPHGTGADHPFKGDMDMSRFKRCVPRTFRKLFSSLWSRKPDASAASSACLLRCGVGAPMLT